MREVLAVVVAKLSVQLFRRRPTLRPHRSDGNGTGSELLVKERLAGGLVVAPARLEEGEGEVLDFVGLRFPTCASQVSC